VASTHVVESTPETVRSGYLDPDAKPVAVIQPGDTVRYPNTWTHWGNEAKFGMSFADREPLRHQYPHGPYSMVGPVEVAGAQPGDVIEVSITALRTIGWGWNSFPLGVGALPHDFAEPYVHYFTFDDARTTAAYTHGITLQMAPFLGVVAAEPAGSEQVSAIVAGSYGGNLVLRDLGVGSRVGSHLFLPVAKPGGRIWTGDVHALQGDGVVDQTAIETAAEDLEIRYDLHRQVALRGPLGETDTAWIVVAFAASLDDALVACLREVIYWLPLAAGITGPEAYALASMAVSFRVTQCAPGLCARHYGHRRTRVARPMPGGVRGDSVRRLIKEKGWGQPLEPRAGAGETVRFCWGDAGHRTSASAVLRGARRRGELHPGRGAHVHRPADPEPADPAAGRDRGRAVAAAPPGRRPAHRGGRGAA
jgi:acetamidase/formamidase